MEYKFLTKIEKKSGKLEDFDKRKIEDSIFKAAKSVGGKDRKTASELAGKVVHRLKMRFGTKTPSAYDIQKAVEKELVEGGHAQTSKAFILYAQKQNEMRASAAFLERVTKIVDDYLQINDWRVSENSNASYSFGGLQGHISGAVIAEYTLRNIYPQEIGKAHREADFHIHDLGNGVLSGYCAGWSFAQLLREGFNGVSGRVASKPAGHIHTALGQLVNFFGTLQSEWAGAQAFSSFDTYLAPFVAKDKLSYSQVKQAMQEFIFSVNATSRWGGQVPFTNLTLDWEVPEDMAKSPVIVGGKALNATYSDFQDEMDLINKAFLEVLMEGDKNGRVFTFPIPTYNITKEFDWNSENSQLLFEATGKYGLPYFQNFINSSLKPTDVRSMCCRLQLDMRELRSKTGGLFGSGEKTGSVGVVTINMPKIGHVAKDESEFFERLEMLMYLGKESLEIKRKEVSKNIKNGLLPWTKRYLGDLNNHFSTIGLVGMHEACTNFLGLGINTIDGRKFSLQVLDFMRARLSEFQEETGHIYNLEATPAEGTSYRLARIDKKFYPSIKSSGTNHPFYTNSTQLPVDYTDDIFEALEHQDELQTKYTGGTVFHGFIGESITETETCGKLVKKIASGYKMPYFTVSPVFTICPEHGYIRGKHYTCPMHN